MTTYYFAAATEDEKGAEQANQRKKVAALNCTMFVHGCYLSQGGGNNLISTDKVCARAGVM